MSVVKPNQRNYPQPITAKTNYPMNQSELEANANANARVRPSRDWIEFGLNFTQWIEIEFGLRFYFGLSWS